MAAPSYSPKGGHVTTWCRRDVTWRICQGVAGFFWLWHWTGTTVWQRAIRYLKQSLSFWDLEHSIKSWSAGTSWMETTEPVNYYVQFNKGMRENYKRAGSVFSLKACQEFSCGFALHAKLEARIFHREHFPECRSRYSTAVISSGLVPSCRISLPWLLAI